MPTSAACLARSRSADLAASADPGLIASPGPRYFGFVIGGSLPAAIAADWLVSAWDQRAAADASPLLSVVEDVAARWSGTSSACPPIAGWGS